MNSIEKYPDIRIYKEKEKCFIKISSVFVEITESEFEKLYSKFLEKYQILFDKNKESIINYIELINSNINQQEEVNKSLNFNEKTIDFIKKEIDETNQEKIDNFHKYLIKSIESYIGKFHGIKSVDRVIDSDSLNKNVLNIL